MRLVDGQGADVAFERRADVGLAECVTMAENKTAALLGCACALGALTGGGSDEQIDELRQFGEHLGLAFQFVDDLLGIWGDPAVTGKPVYSDLAGRKKSLPVVAHWAPGRRSRAIWRRCITRTCCRPMWTLFASLSSCGRLVARNGRRPDLTMRSHWRSGISVPLVLHRVPRPNSERWRR
jgi:geranylgeranyl pyrophosphate synthase